MAETAASTAYGPMFVAALEQSFPPPQRILDDPLAYALLPFALKSLVKVGRLARRPLSNLLEKTTPGIYAAILCRKRYIEDAIIAALADGIDSLVILGAGLDTLAYRLPQLASVRVYEVDLPEIIAYKRKALTALYGTLPAHVALVPVDFADQTLEAVLRETGYAFDQRHFFVWEGVTQYLKEAAVRDCFRFLAQASPGSRVVFTYALKDFIDGHKTYDSDVLYRRFRVKNQLWHFGLHPPDVPGFIGEYGWKMREEVGAAAFAGRYLDPAGRTEPISKIERTVYAEKRL